VAGASRDRTTALALARAFAFGAWVWRERRVNPPYVEAMLQQVADGRRSTF
jgi:hypothetical protein